MLLASLCKLPVIIGSASAMVLAFVSFFLSSWGMSALLLRLDYLIIHPPNPEAVESVARTIRLSDGVNLVVAFLLSIVYLIGQGQALRRFRWRLADVLFKPVLTGVICTILISIYGLTIGRLADATAFSGLAALVIFLAPLAAIRLVNRLVGSRVKDPDTPP